MATEESNAAIIDSQDEKKKEVTKKKPPSIPPPTLLIDALRKRYPAGFTLERTKRWSEKLKEEDLEHLSDFLEVSASALSEHSNRYTTGLYGLLTSFKQKCDVFEITIKEKLCGEIIKEQKYMEGYYIYCGDRVNGHKLFVNIRGGGYEEDPSGQFVLYARAKDKKWAIHRAHNVPKDGAWILSDQSIQSMADWKNKQGNGVSWRYYNDKDGYQPVKLKVKYWNLY